MVEVMWCIEIRAITNSHCCESARMSCYTIVSIVNRSLIVIMYLKYAIANLSIPMIYHWCMYNKIIHELFQCLCRRFNVFIFLFICSTTLTPTHFQCLCRRFHAFIYLFICSMTFNNRENCCLTSYVGRTLAMARVHRPHPVTASHRDLFEPPGGSMPCRSA